MARRSLRWLVGAYPKAWRNDHGPELSSLVDELVEDGAHRGSLAFDLIKGGLGVRWRSLRATEVLLAGCAVVLLTLGVTYGAQFASEPQDSPTPSSHANSHTMTTPNPHAPTPTRSSASEPSSVVSSSSPSCQISSFTRGDSATDSGHPLAVVNLCTDRS